ncbi:MAG: hypothetical protein J7J38_02565 [Candidatus Aenigmarchaeota archaeon]|nr:hypothetical protein [Candidatus Aenigmarchaeota archaeon]
MLLPEIQKKLLELQMSLKDDGGSRIDDIGVVQDGEYGYVVVLTSFKGDIHDEVLKLKLRDLNGKQILPDLWFFGPCVTREKN